MGPAWLRALGVVSTRVGLLHSDEDHILQLSKVLNGNLKRLGRSGPIDRSDKAIYPQARYRFVDCSSVVDTGPDGGLDASHQYYRREPIVRDDIALMMAGKGSGGRVVLT